MTHIVLLYRRYDNPNIPKAVEAHLPGHLRQADLKRIVKSGKRIFITDNLLSLQRRTTSYAAVGAYLLYRSTTGENKSSRRGHPWGRTSGGFSKICTKNNFFCTKSTQKIPFREVFSCFLRRQASRFRRWAPQLRAVFSCRKSQVSGKITVCLSFWAGVSSASRFLPEFLRRALPRR